MTTTANPNMPPFFIDFEACGGGGDGEFVIKELCIMDCTRPLDPIHFIYQPTIPWRCLTDAQRRTCIYLTKHYHKLAYSEGRADGSYFCAACIERQLDDKFPSQWRNELFYVMDGMVDGGPKYKFLHRKLPKLRLVNYHISLKRLTPLPQSQMLTCPHRNHGSHCAYLKCCRLVYEFHRL